MSPKMLGMVLVPVILAVALSGCRAPFSKPDEKVIETRDAARMDLLERESRARQNEVAKLQAEVSSLKGERHELRTLLEEARRTVKSLEESGKAPAEKPFSFEVARVDFSFLTCAIDTDDTRGDDAIAAYVYLYDQFDSSLKAAGHFRFELFDLARPKSHVVESWSLKPEAAARYWQRFPACYQFKLPLAEGPLPEKAKLKVTFTREGEKALTASREVKIERP